MNGPRGSLGVLLATEDEADLLLAARLLRAALERGAEARLFLMDAGVGAAHSREVAALVEAGVEATLCATNAAARGIEPPEGVPAGDQGDHARMLRDCDRVLSFT